ncbi:MAG: hypothetical protein GX786_07585 [Clostridiales bacterium]|nr:hypothetical protein [Clostridiales bacterium]
MNIDQKKRITIFVGNYGSGKTELSLDYALKSIKSEPTTLVDLDIVNPYFRSSEKKQLLLNSGVHVLMPTFAETAVDVPALPAEIQSVFDQKNSRVIFDVGGDDTGAAALGRYYPYFAEELDQVQVFFVVNTLRPLSADTEGITDLLFRIQNRSRLAVTGLIHNSNLADETTLTQLLEGEEIIKEVAKVTKLPIVSTVMMQSLFAQAPQWLQENAWIIERRMVPEWMVD